VWQELREELRPQGVEIVTVCLDTADPALSMPYVEAASPTHPTLFDPHHLVDELFGMINVPNGVWIDENGMIVRPAESAWPGERAEAPASDDAPVAEAEPTPTEPAPEMPSRIIEMMGQAAQIVSNRDSYAAALRDWAANGADSQFVMSADEVLAASGPRGAHESSAAAHFELATHLEMEGNHDAAVPHFAAAHRLAPDNWTYRRQAWSIEPSALPGPMSRFWQGPIDGNEDAWPYEGSWVDDIKVSGPANYYKPMQT
jgi:hypothetical protein